MSLSSAVKKPMKRSLNHLSAKLPLKRSSSQPDVTLDFIESKEEKHQTGMKPLIGALALVSDKKLEKHCPGPGQKVRPDSAGPVRQVM